MYRNEDFFRVIGHISVFFATLDFFVSQVLVELTRDKRGKTAPFREKATLGQKLEVLGRLQPDEVTNPAVLAEIQSTLPRAADAAEERNRYIHDQWVFAPVLVSQGRIRRVRLKYPLSAGMRQEELSIAELLKFQREVGALQTAFAGYLKSLTPSAFKGART